MSFKMNEKDKNTMLDNVLSEDEIYTAKILGVIMASPSSMKAIGAVGGVAGMALGTVVAGGVGGALGALSNESCYIGLTDKRIIFSVVSKLDVSKAKAVFDIELSKITKVKFKFSIIPGRKVIVIKYNGGSIKLSLISKIFASDFKGQKEGVETLVNRLSEISC